MADILNKLMDGLRRISWTGQRSANSSEHGRIASDENAARRLYSIMQPDFELRAVILELRKMDRLDPRVKKIHSRMASTATKGGLIIEWRSETSPTIQREWKQFKLRLQLNRQTKLESDVRGLVMEGNLAIQWVLDQNRVVSGLRMPVETLEARVDSNGRFIDPRCTYVQHDLVTGRQIAEFPLWQMTVERLSPDNLDDHGAWGRPYLDASRKAWRMLVMSEEDLVIRRRTRAAQRFSHILEGATDTDLEKYRNQVENDRLRDAIATDFYLNKKGGVTALQGDANLDQISDVVHLLDTFFAGAPAPKGIFGYANGLSRDILLDLKQDYFDEIDALQDTASMVYEQGFKLHLLLQGIDPNNFDFSVCFAERRTETLTQATDRALKQQALGVPAKIYLRTAGIDPEEAAAARAESDPYPDASPSSIAPVVKITPNNAPKGDSATSINNG